MAKKKHESKEAKVDWKEKVQQAYDELRAGGETAKRRALSILGELLIDGHEEWQSEIGDPDANE